MTPSRRPKSNSVVQATIGMAQAKHQGGLRAIAGDPDHDAVGCPLSLDLDPASLAWLIAAVRALGDDAFEAGHQRQPLLGFGERARLRNELQVWVRGLEECFELVSAIAQGQVRQIGTSLPQHVEREQNRRPLTGRPDRIPSRAAEPFLESAEVRPPVDVTISPSRSVSSGRSRPALTSSGKPGEVVQVPAEQLDRAATRSPEHAPEPIELGFVSPLLAAWESPLQSCQHRLWYTGKHARRSVLVRWTTGDGGSAKRLPGGSVTDALQDARAFPEQAFYYVGRELNTWKRKLSTLVRPVV
jgi:hypothetical protein